MIIPCPLPRVIPRPAPAWVAAISGPSLDPDAAAYIAAVEAADGQALEPAIRIAYDEFICGCKDDTFDITNGDVVAGSTFRNWDRFKASCILAGARTLSGALVPLVGSAPANTNNNFVTADYVRATGLKGDGSTKWLNSNRNNNADPQDNFSGGAWIQENASGGANRAFIGAGVNEVGAFNIARRSDGSDFIVRNRSSVLFISSPNAPQTGLVGCSRSKADAFQFRNGEFQTTHNLVSEVPFNRNISVFGRNLAAESDARLQFYWVGEALDLAALNARLATLTAAIATALA